MEKRELDAEKWVDSERIAQHRLIGVLLFPVALFPLLSLLTYNWRDISWLNSPPLSPPANLIGMVGAWSVFVGYSLIGLAVWIVPVLTLFFSGMLLYGRIMRVGLRAFWMALFVVALCCLIQLGSATTFDALLGELNMRPNAGGAIGYWVMTRLLERWFSPFGGGALMLSIMLLSLVLAIGPGTLFGWVRRLSGWCTRGVGSLFHRDHDTFAEGDDGHSDQVGEDGLTAKERKRQAKEAAKEAARKAREEARAAREAEREQKRVEKERNSFSHQRTERQEQLKQMQEAARAEQLKYRFSHPEQSAEEQRMEQIRQRAEAARLAASRANAVIPNDPSPVMPVSVAATPSVSAPAPVAAAPAVSAPAAIPSRKPESKSIALSVKPSSAALASGKAKAERKAEADDQPESDAAEPVTYDLPPLSLLNESKPEIADHGNVQETAQMLVDALARFRISSEVVRVTPGPIVTQYEVRPAPDVKVERIKNLADTLQMTLSATSLRIEAPIPGKDVVGFEIPNKRRGSVTFGEIVRGEVFQNNRCEIPLLLGKDVSGADMIVDLAKLSHLLVAGSTGSGKSVCLNSIIIGLLMSRTPDQLRLILVDPKRVEFTPYNNLPHLLVPVITDPKKVVFGLRWAIVEMERRLKLFQRYGKRNIVAYNTRERTHHSDELFDMPPDEDTLPYIVVVVDEVASLMQLKGVGKEVDAAISKLAALSRAAGIHLILATQRPSVDVITGTIKNNVPGRIAFKVTQSNDSRTILDSPGAETLIGKGDMLYLKNDGQLVRAQGAWLDDSEVARVTEYVCEHYQPIYDQGLSETLDKVESQSEADQLNEELEGSKNKDKVDAEESQGGAVNGPDSDEEVMKNAIEVIYRMNRASTTVLQRRLKIGYTKASRIMDMLEERGYVGPQNGAATREILVDLGPIVAQNSGFDPAEAMAMNAEMAAEAQAAELSQGADPGAVGDGSGNGEE